MAGFNMDDYNDVPSRIRQFRERYPEGSLQPANPSNPFTVLSIGGTDFIAFCAAAYRTPDDARPGIGTAYEPVPGKTQFTKDSELQNAETAAWGRAIVAALVADTKRIASTEEVRNRNSAHGLVDQASVARAEIAKIGQARGLSIDELADEYRVFSDGGDIATAPADRLGAFLATLTRQAASA